MPKMTFEKTQDIGNGATQQRFHAGARWGLRADLRLGETAFSPVALNYVTRFIITVVFTMTGYSRSLAMPPFDIAYITFYLFYLSVTETAQNLFKTHGA